MTLTLVETKNEKFYIDFEGKRQEKYESYQYMRQGQYRLYGLPHDKKVVESTCNYVDGLIEGEKIYYFFHEDKYHLHEKTTYIGGEKNGLYEMYYKPSGRLLKRCNFFNDKLQGYVFYYKDDDANTIIDTEYYINGVRSTPPN